MKTEVKGLEFDPGFAPYIMAFRGTVEYLYMDINRFKNLSQRKMKFRQYYKKFLELFNFFTFLKNFSVFSPFWAASLYCS